MITANTILTRRSVRTYDGRAVEPEKLERVKAFAREAENPFGIPVTFVFLDAKEQGLSSPVLTGEPLYVAGKVPKAPYGEVAFGFSMEKLLLYAWSLGLGSVWIGGTMKREAFEGAAAKGESERMPCVSPLGYPAAKRSLRETVMRRGCKADSRLDGKKLFFDGTFDTPLAGKALEPWGDVLELVRWAPSAVNRQPWRLVLRDGWFHFCLRHDKGYLGEAVGDMQKIDLGIALCHFVLGAEEQGLTCRVEIRDPGIPLPPETEYIASAALTKKAE
ncbi:MAG: nitroreductase [Clostridia bacterium]|nr:nitroreductase [Clostridia bacterium]